MEIPCPNPKIWLSGITFCKKRRISQPNWPKSAFLATAPCKKKGKFPGQTPQNEQLEPSQHAKKGEFPELLFWDTQNHGKTLNLGQKKKVDLALLGTQTSPNLGFPRSERAHPSPQNFGSALPDPKFSTSIPQFLTRETLVVFGATGAEASNKVALAAGKESIIEVLGLKPRFFWVKTGWARQIPRFWGENPPFFQSHSDFSLINPTLRGGRGGSRGEFSLRGIFFWEIPSS